MHDLGTDSLERKARPETVHKKKKYRSVRLRKKRARISEKKKEEEKLKKIAHIFRGRKRLPGQTPPTLASSCRRGNFQSTEVRPQEVRRGPQEGLKGVSYAQEGREDVGGPLGRQEAEGVCVKVG